MRNKDTSSGRHRNSHTGNQEHRVESQLIATSSHGSPVTDSNNENDATTSGTSCKLPPSKKMRLQKKATAATTGTTTMVTPRPMDVRLGRGKSFSIHLGNNILHELVSSYKLEYMSSLNLRKWEITTDIVNRIHTNGGRFIKQCEDDKEMWLIVSTETARQKVAHAMQYQIRTGQNPTDEQQQQQRQQPISTLTGQYSESAVDINTFKSMTVTPTDGIDYNSNPHCHHCHHPTLLLHQQFSSIANRSLQHDSVQPLDASLLSLYRLREIGARRIDRCPQQPEHEHKLLYMQHPLSSIYCYPGHDVQRLSQQNHDHFSYISNGNFINESNQALQCTEKINDIPLDSLFYSTNPNSISMHEEVPKFMRNYTLGSEYIPNQIDPFVTANCKSSIFESAGCNTNESRIFHTGFVKSPPVPITFQANRSNKKLVSTSSCGDILEQCIDDECCNESTNSALSFDALDLSGIGSLNEYDFKAPVEECANKSVCLR